jgi:hypothetical protein
VVGIEAGPFLPLPIAGAAATILSHLLLGVDGTGIRRPENGHGRQPPADSR